MHPILSNPQRLRWLLLGCGLVGLLIGALVHPLFDVPWPEALAFGLPIGLMAAPMSLSAWYLCRALPLDRTTPTQLVLTTVVAAIITSLVWAGLGRVWWTRLTSFGLAMPSGEAAGLISLLGGVGAFCYLLAIAVHYSFQASEVSAAATRRALEAQVGQRDAELRALRAQLNPHFLFNSLNSIAGLVTPDPEKARRMCQLLGDFLRESLTVGAASRVPLSREVALAEQYLAIEQVRFGQRLTVRTAVTTEAGAVPVPPLILQPLVENAVRHGIATRLDGGTVEIDATQMGVRVVIAVTNPRDAEGGRRGTGLGLDIVRRRLAAAFGESATVAVEAVPERYKVSVTIPVEPDPGSEKPR
jgi:two-component system sensor histidine kinase AlgZ